MYIFFKNARTMRIVIWGGGAPAPHIGLPISVQLSNKTKTHTQHAAMSFLILKLR